MKVVLLLAGAFLGLDAAVTWLMLLLWAARGHKPDFVTPTAFGAWSMAAVALKCLAGLFAAVQLLRLKRSGRLIGVVVLANNAVFTLVAALRADRLEGVAWATIGINAILLALLVLPAAGEACRD